MPTDDDTFTRPPAHVEDEAQLEAEADDDDLDDMDDDEVEAYFAMLLDEALRER